MQEQNNFKYVFKGEEVSKEQFIKLAKDSFKWFSDNTIQAVDFDSISKFFSGDYKSGNEIDRHFKGVLENQEKQYPNLGDCLNKEEPVNTALCEGGTKLYFDKEGYLIEKEEQKVFKDWNRKENLPPYKEAPLGELLENWCNELVGKKENKTAYKETEGSKSIFDKIQESSFPFDAILTPAKEFIEVRDHSNIPIMIKLNKKLESKEKKILEDWNKPRPIDTNFRQFATGIKESQSTEKAPIFTYCKVNKNALEALSLRALYGHIKYEEGNDWENFSRVPNGDFEYSNAMFRHALGIGGEETEKEHLVSTAWNAISRLEIYLRNNKK